MDLGIMIPDELPNFRIAARISDSLLLGLTLL